MRPEELRTLTQAELQEKLREFKEKLFRLKIELASGRGGKPSELKKLKKTVARIKTILRERELKGKTQ